LAEHEQGRDRCVAWLQALLIVLDAYSTSESSRIILIIIEKNLVKEDPRVLVVDRDRPRWLLYMDQGSCSNLVRWHFGELSSLFGRIRCIDDRVILACYRRVLLSITLRLRVRSLLEGARCECVGRRDEVVGWCCGVILPDLRLIVIATMYFGCSVSPCLHAVLTISWPNAPLSLCLLCCEDCLCWLTPLRMVSSLWAVYFRRTIIQS
jgi:hypothetical protein